MDVLSSVARLPHDVVDVATEFVPEDSTSAFAFACKQFLASSVTMARLAPAQVPPTLCLSAYPLPVSTFLLCLSKWLEELN